ncbi:acyltransferase family protein [Actinoplanes rectilineatus]|uniref:acyltransferase family protein n=1 Tax=Actinoplanes rectilineatus TaxID=113571 RepID=UPI0005F2D608|nr:acyltransferase [Actinoplanes rectilineatus]
MTSRAAQPTTPLTRLPSLTGLRWIAAFLVFGFHVGTLNLIEPDRWHRAWDSVFGLGASGVSFFFVLSGFVLAWSARPGDGMFRFWGRRLAKIYPSHLVTWAVVIGVMIWWGDTIDWNIALTNLGLLQTWTSADGYQYSINSVSWSLCCEVFFYLCLPFAMPLLRRTPSWVLYAGLALLPVLMLLVSQPLGLQDTPLGQVFPLTQFVSEEQSWWFTQLFPPVRSLEFWTGVLAGVLMTRRHWFGPGLWISTLFFVAVYATCSLVVPGEYWLAVLTVGYVVLIAGAAKADLSGVRSPWRTRPMVWLGEVSFAFYLVHVALIQNVLRLLERGGEGWDPLPAAGAIAASVAGSLLLAWLLHTCVENPMMKLLAPRRRKQAPAVPAQRAPASPSAPSSPTMAGQLADIGGNRSE